MVKMKLLSIKEKEFYKLMRNPICFKMFGLDDWSILRDNHGGIFFKMDDAIKYVRQHKTLKEWGTQLAPLKFAKVDESTWDNL